MILNSYIHQQWAAAHRRDLVEAAERGRLAAQARQGRQHSSARQPFRLAFRWPGPRHRAALEPSPCATSPTTVR
jgi:hypothetical protein